ncbi:hypothetical protein PsorP6_014814 [Peronosclerospora sorghi]|uniref:Uncharacterized protein n=1 Tax=Peronosclerospora sorghi TaxID=230839 RepID=A0ACC0VRH2_9STRA|nr:hypothetical protein PsorP6_014814 [Peronosclerospora sorghi]
MSAKVLLLYPLIHLVVFIAISYPCSSLEPDPMSQYSLEATTVSNLRRLRETGAIIPHELARTVEKAALAFLKIIGRDLSKSRESALLEQQVLKAATSVLFSHLDFVRWIDYVNEFKRTYPEHELSVIPTLTRYFGDDTLFKILDTAANDPRFKTLARILQTDQVEFWKKTHKDPEEVFRILGLANEEMNLFQDSHFLTWVTYVEDFNASNPPKHRSILSMITKYHEVAVLLRQIDEAKRVENDTLKRVVSSLESDLLKYVIHTKTFTGALDLLQLEKTPTARSETFSKHLCTILLQGYMAKLPDTEIALIRTLITRFGDEFVAATILVMKRNHTPTQVTEKLESALREHWLSTDRSARDVFMLLKLTGPEAMVFDSNSRLTLWVSYLDYQLEKKPEMTEIVLRRLSIQFSTQRLNQILVQAMEYPHLRRAIQVKTLFNSKRMSPDVMFTVAGLDEDEEMVFRNPWFARWLAYEDEYSRHHPKYKGSLVSLFYTHFGSDSVSKFIEEVYHRCMRNRTTPSAFLQILGLINTSKTSLAYSTLFATWKQYQKEFQQLRPGNNDMDPLS